MLFLSHLAYSGRPLANLTPTQKHSFPVKEIWMQLWLPHLLARHSPDLCHFTNSIAPLLFRGAYVVTLHDLSLVKHPEWHPPSRRAWMARIIRPSIARASGIICDSEATRKDLLEWLRVSESKVRVVPLAARTSVARTCSEVEKQTVRRRYGLLRPYFLYVGNIEPRKNLCRLLKAFRLANPPGLDLVLAGRFAWLWRTVRDEADHPQHRGKLHFLDYVAEEDLAALYQSAVAFVYPSLMEGFGLPVLEAMASGVPVLASNVEPLASLVGEDGWLLPPEDVDGWRRAVSEAAGDREKRMYFAAAGRRRAAQYSWERVARETMSCYEDALALKSPAGRPAVPSTTVGRPH